MHLFSVVFLVFLQLLGTLASVGDRSPYYQGCVKRCMTTNCTDAGGVNFKGDLGSQQDFHCWLLMWNCRDECKYECMWKTVYSFNERGFALPKFHGKWPFVRYLGMQEPASVFFSFCNLIVHIKMLMNLRKFYSKSYQRLYNMWHIFAVLCITSWFWSTVFHARDTPLTEFMDYAGAMSMMVALFMTAVFRMLHRNLLASAVMLIPLMVYYCDHLRYLYFGHVDYAYNLAVNIVIGILGSVLWLVWAIYQFRQGREYCFQLMWFVVLTGSVLVFEVMDFPPLFFILDAHAMWHCSTILLIVIFYRFVMDDLHYVTKSMEKKDHKIA